ncbi:flagellar basal body-associated FliL family protein [Gemmobacter serpentinus]|uniref:flagellar basal body-associated FliL family protein n=1 Tax=Gemmobacter serpentinus TaxID=2652247 RepID=UPI00124C6317|nr:flagellar basal body-associated FliL family protein [Gemmobacter serpentinus]
MKNLIMLILVVLLVAGSGVAAGYFLRPPPDATAMADPDVDPGDETSDDPSETDEYAKMSNPFIIPLIEGARIESIVVISLAIEAKAGSIATVYDMEPKLRDAFLSVMFDHANTGGFRGAFTDGQNLERLRRQLRDVAVKLMPDTVKNVLITDIGRRDS